MVTSVIAVNGRCRYYRMSFYYDDYFTLYSRVTYSSIVIVTFIIVRVRYVLFNVRFLYSCVLSYVSIYIFNGSPLVINNSVCSSTISSNFSLISFISHPICTLISFIYIPSTPQWFNVFN